MSFRPRMKTLAWAVSIALAQLAGQAMADSAVGIDSVLGNTLNPPGRSNIPKPQAVDPDLIGAVRRSPSGQLYGVPVAEAEQQQTESGWLYNGEVEAGGIGFSGDEKNAFFRTYKDTTHGAILNWFSMDANKPDEARYVQVYGGGVGRKDQFYGVLTGRYNEWKLRAFYNETFHIFTDSWKTPYDGEGTGNLSLAGGLAIPQRIVDGSAHATGDANYIGIATTCSAATPCWSYNGTLYGLGAGATVALQQTTQLNAIRGIMGTPTANGTMPVTPTPQSGQAGAIAAKLSAMEVKDLSLSRKKAGLRLDNTLSDAWKSYVSYSFEKREGARPFGLVYNNQFSADIAEPIDYDTHEFLTGLSFARDKNQVNLRASYSRFQNNIDTLNVEFPILAGVTNSGVLNHTSYALNPDNDAFNLKAEYGRDLDFWKSRFTAALSYGVNRQDAKLLAPITGVMNADYANANVTTFTGTNPGFAAGTGLVSSWNTTKALSQTTADQEIDNYLGNLAFNMKPTDALRVKTEVRYFATDNKGGYMAYNPLTGQFGRGPLDPNSVVNIDAVVGSQQYANGQTITANSGCYVPPGYPAPTVPGCLFANGAAGAITNGNNIPVFGQARSTQQTNYVAGVDYDLTRFQSVNAQYEQELFHRTFRERADTWEDKYKVGYVNRDLWDWGSLRLSYEEDRKRGSEYRYRTFEDLGTGLPGLDVNYIIQQAAAGNPLYNNATTFAANLFSRYSYYFRKYDQADRDQSILNARFIITPRDDMDVGITLQAKDVKYPDSYYGTESDKLNSATVDVNFQPSTDTNLFGFVSHQDSKKTMKMNSGQAVGVVTTWCTAAQVTPDKYWLCSDGNGTATQPGTSGTRPLSSAWSSDTEDNNQVVGLGMSHNFGRFTLGLDYAYSYGQTKIKYKYGSTAISSATAVQAPSTNTLQQNATLVNAAAGYSLDDMTFDQQTVTLNFVMMLTKKLGIRVFDRYEEGKVNDWHYDNVIMNQVTNIENGNLMTDAGPQSYHANEIGVLLNYKF